MLLSHPPLPFIPSPFLTLSPFLPSNHFLLASFSLLLAFLCFVPSLLIYNPLSLSSFLSSLSPSSLSLSSTQCRMVVVKSMGSRSRLRLLIPASPGTEWPWLSYLISLLPVSVTVQWGKQNGYCGSHWGSESLKGELEDQRGHPLVHLRKQACPTAEMGPWVGCWWRNWWGALASEGSHSIIQWGCVWSARPKVPRDSRMWSGGQWTAGT